MARLLPGQPPSPPTAALGGLAIAAEVTGQSLTLRFEELRARVLGQQ